MSSYYYKSERECAYWALRALQTKLPSTPRNPSEFPEWGTMLFRWPDAEGGSKYAYQPIYKAITRDGLWRSVGVPPPLAEFCAAAHTHPNGTWYSNIDLETARGERGLVRQKMTMYMVNDKGGFWYDGVTDARLAGTKSSVRFGALWGAVPR